MKLTIGYQTPERSALPHMIDAVLEEAIMKRIKAIPVFDSLGVQILEFSEGQCIAKVPRNKDFDGIFETFHGGMLMTVADTIACFAILTRIGPDTHVATTDMNIRFLAPCLTDVKAVATAIKVGKLLCPVHVDLFDDNEQRVAIAQVTYVRLNSMPQR